MSLDDLITLLLVVLFVGLPLAQRILGRFMGSQRPGEGEAGRPRRESPEGAGERSPDADKSRAETSTRTSETQRAGGRQTAGAGESQGAPSGASELERRIAEARRRVQEAREGSAAQTGRGAQPAAPSGSQSSSRPLVAARTDPQAFLGREGGATATAQTAGFLGREGVREEPRKRTAPLQVSKRTRKPRGSTLSKARGVVSLSRGDIFNGIVWHQILSEPVSARYARRKSSRVR